VHRLDLCLFVVFEEAALRVSGALVRHAPTADALAFAAQIVFYGLAAYGAYLSRRDLRQAVTADDTREHSVNELMKGTTTS